MIALRTKRHRSTARLAALLLVLQGLAGGAVSLVHASERFNAPAHVEAQHSSSCVQLHDALRCPLCHYAGTRVVPQHVRLQSAEVVPAERAPHTRVARPANADYLTAPPRGPPLARS
ncbi:MAG TPA: hypothetical protein VFU41_10725 [Gemmatimonadales bacterium]|nr:hypothetical protein [Gemmatimonadales bacterium]